MSNTRKRSRIRPVEQGQFYDFGVYMWQMPNGSFIADDDRNFLNIPSQKGDIVRIGRLRDAVKAFGITEGEPVFFAGHRRVTDEEYYEQQERLKDGYIPDDHDLPAMVEDARDQRRN
jgi:hypothetical protein